MKTYLSIVMFLLSLPVVAQENWVEEKGLDYSIKHPSTWTVSPSTSSNELLIKAPTPDFKGKSNFLGTTLFLELKDKEYSTIDSAGIAYKYKILNTPMLSKAKFTKEKKIEFNGVNAIEFEFTSEIENIKTGCRIIIFNYKNTYYELSVTYDRRLNKKLIKEAFMVIDSFKLNS